MSVRIKDLSLPQQRFWRLARAYAKAEVGYAEAHYAYRSTGDPAGMPQVESKRERAASRLFNAIKNADIQ